MQLFASIIRLLNGIFRIIRQNENKIDKYQLIIDGMNLCGHKDVANQKEKLLRIAKKAVEVDTYKKMTEVNGYESGLVWSLYQRKVFNADRPSLEKMWYYISQIEDDILKMHGIVQIIDHSIENFDIKEALVYVDKLESLKTPSFKDTRAKGFRRLLNYYAIKGDLDNFKKYLKKSESIRDRHEISRFKVILIENMTASLGIDDAVKICDDKIFGDKYLYTILYPYIEKVSFNQMKELLRKKELEPLTSENKTEFLVETFANEIKNGNFNQNVFDELFELIDLVDKKIRNGDQKLRDWLFMRLGANLTDIELVIKCRKAIGNNRVKEELRLVEKKLTE